MNDNLMILPASEPANIRLIPLWLSNTGIPQPLPPLYAAIIIALLLVFLPGVFPGRLADISWLHVGSRPCWSL